VDACLGSMGIVHGPLDLKMIRDVDEGLRTANQCFSRAGAVKVAGIDEKVAHAKDVLLERYQEGDSQAELAMETMLMTIVMEIWGLAGISHNEMEGVVLTGSVGSMLEPFDFFGSLKSEVEDIGGVVMLPPTSGSVGSAQIAQAVFEGSIDILGIEVQSND
jgi:putative methanogenesis marker protein 12